jgi:hypothetical protein
MYTFDSTRVCQALTKKKQQRKMKVIVESVMMAFNLEIECFFFTYPLRCLISTGEIARHNLHWHFIHFLCMYSHPRHNKVTTRCLNTDTDDNAFVATLSLNFYSYS